MELIKVELPKDYRLAITSDYHVGSIMFKEQLFKKYVVKPLCDEPDLYMVINGDFTEAIIPGDKRFNLRTTDKRFDSPQDAVEYLIELLNPIPKGKIIGGCLGNHEIKNAATFDAFKILAEKLGIPYGAGIYKLIAMNGNKIMHKYLMCHGRKGMLSSNAKDEIQIIANEQAMQKRTLEKMRHSDCIVQAHGHHHRRLVVEPTFNKTLHLSDDGRKIIQKGKPEVNQSASYIPPEYRWYVGTGSYRGNLCDPGSGAFDYAEHFPPADLGHVVARSVDGEIVEVVEVKA